MRELAHGIYPPLLEAEGLGAALAAAGRSADIPIHLEISNIDRYSRQVEETAYFCVTGLLDEALMAGATDARVLIQGESDGLTFKVTYDVTTHSLNTTTLADRIDAAEGTLKRDSTSQLTSVTIHLPGRVKEPA
jgi:signal transduction histidine kinase